MRYDVIFFDPNLCEAAYWGTVVLPSDPHQIRERDLERALASLGIYAPRGQDEVRWQPATRLDGPMCEITSADGQPMVALFGIMRTHGVQAGGAPCGDAACHFNRKGT